MKYGAYDHVHVSEREPGAWTDCTWASGVELARSAGEDCPATRAEYEALRVASGDIATPDDPGSNLWDLERGMRARYGWAGTIATGIANLTPGRAAVVIGKMGVWPVGSKWRRWQPPFAGNHAVAVFRLDGEARVWWCDPLAPTAWEGEWMPLAELARFMTSLGQRLMWVEMNSRRAPMIATVTATPFAGGKNASVKIPAGTTLSGYDPARPGAPVKTLTWNTASTFPADARCSIAWSGTTVAPVPRGGPFLRAVAGAYLGLYVPEAGLVVTEPPDPTPYSKAQLDAATAAAKVAGAAENEQTWEAWVASHP